jgi:hypothetical protein
LNQRGLAYGKKVLAGNTSTLCDAGGGLLFWGANGAQRGKLPVVAHSYANFPSINTLWPACHLRT